jgi:hypothetical protein
VSAQTVSRVESREDGMPGLGPCAGDDPSRKKWRLMDGKIECNKSNGINESKNALVSCFPLLAEAQVPLFRLFERRFL